MKERIYLKVCKGKQGYKFAVSKKKNFTPMNDGAWRKEHFPTLLVGLNIEIPDTYFREADAELRLFIKNPEIAKDIKVEEDNLNTGGK